MNIEKSKKNIKKFLSNHRHNVYKILPENKFEGYRYQKISDDFKNNIYFDIILTEENALIFEAIFDIHVVDDTYLPSVIRYCQEICPKYGSFYVENNTVKYHSEDCLIDNPLSIDTIEVYETEVLRLYSIHYDNLLALSKGHFLLLNNDTHKVLVSESAKDYDSTIQNIQDFLEKSDAITIYKDSEESEEGILFYYKTFVNENQYRLCFYLTDGVLILKGFYGENPFKVPEAYRYIVSDYLNQLNIIHKYSSLSIGAKGDELFGSICTSLLDGSIGKDTLYFMQFFLLMTLEESRKDVEKLCAGLSIRKTENEAFNYTTLDIAYREHILQMLRFLGVIRESHLPLPPKIKSPNGPTKKLHKRSHVSKGIKITSEEDSEYSMNDSTDNK